MVHMPSKLGFRGNLPQQGSDFVIFFREPDSSGSLHARGEFPLLRSDDRSGQITHLLVENSCVSRVFPPCIMLLRPQIVLHVRTKASFSACH